MAPKKKYVLVRNDTNAPEETPQTLEIEVKNPKIKKDEPTSLPESVITAPKTTPKQKYKIMRNAKPKAEAEKIVQAIPTTLGQEVQAALEEWYHTRGEQLPEEYVGFGTKIDAEEQTKLKAEMDAQYPPEPAPGEEASTAPKPLGPKPEFGTPEFWKWAAARRKQIDAERAAAGLPPLPTKKEKEAAKQSRIEAREAKAAAKATNK